ncbi:site-2 protease family protein, partial [Rhizobium ruizarguesonis]
LNLMPVPVLYGGHLMFYAVEAVRGKPLGSTAQEIAGLLVGDDADLADLSLVNELVSRVGALRHHRHVELLAGALDRH